jgi:hypothetical protein
VVQYQGPIVFTAVRLINSPSSMESSGRGRKPRIHQHHEPDK